MISQLQIGLKKIFTYAPKLKFNYATKFFFLSILVATVIVTFIITLFVVDFDKKLPTVVALIALIFSLLNTIAVLKPDSDALLLYDEFEFYKSMTSQSLRFIFYNPGRDQIRLILKETIIIDGNGNLLTDESISLSLITNDSLFIHPLSYFDIEAKISFLDIDHILPFHIILKYDTICEGQIRSHEREIKLEGTKA